MNWHALQESLNNDGKISEEEREELLTRGIPDRLLEALADGKIDDQERADLRSMGFPPEVIAMFGDSHLSDAERDKLRGELAETMRRWREQQLQQLFAKFKRHF
jgi:hypothetical protein